MKRFERTLFGSVTIGGKTYHHDIYVLPDGSIETRPSSHVVSEEEIKRIVNANPEVIVIGTGQAGCVAIERKAQNLIEERKIELIALETPEAIRKFNEMLDKGKKVASIVHVTC